MPLLSVEGLGRRFGRRWVFRDLNLEASGPGLILLGGPNGSGKTTLLRVLSTLLAPSEGEGWLDGRSLQRSLYGVRRRLSWVPAMDGGFFPRLKGRENLRLHGALRGMGKREVEGHLEALTSFAPLRAALDCPYYHCSSGMRLALHLARAGLGNPPLWLLDEPTRSLDPEARDYAVDFLCKESERRLVVVATHESDPWGAHPSQRWRLPSLNAQGGEGCR